MNPNLFLILHKVRGEPAFDIAEAVLIDGEEAWIIPTSGHRAYPAKYWKLDDLADVSDINKFGYHTVPAFCDEPLPEALRDHYHQPSYLPPSAERTTARALLAQLGLGPKPIKRRPI